MELSEYLTLPPKERKRLAAKRSRERSRARQKNEEIPPTLEEEFGLKKKTTKKPKPKASVESKTVPLHPDGTPLTQEEIKERMRNPRVIAPAGPVHSPYRTIVGLLNWVVGHDKDEYTGEAIDRGATHRLSYFHKEKELGTIFFEEIDDSVKQRIQSIFLGSSNLRVSFGEVEGI